MTQSHLDNITEEEKNTLIDSKYDTDFAANLEMQHFESTNKNLIRKVEMTLDSDTDIHVYEKKFKIMVKKQTPFYV
jgi:hypothetical protein